MSEPIDMRARVHQLRQVMQSLDQQLKRQREIIEYLARRAGATR